jgi:hypothetical protein
MNTFIELVLVNPVLMGISLVVAWGILHLLSILWMCIWKWLDDSKALGPNHLVRFVMISIFRYKRDGDLCYPYTKSSGLRKVKSDGTISILLPACILVLLPPIVFLAFIFYTVTMVIGVLFILAFVGRFVRRQSKLFKAHVDDKNAH